MSVFAGALNQRVMFQRPLVTKDDYGAVSQAWSDLMEVWAEVKPLSGREALIAGRLSSELTHQISVRYQALFDDPHQVAQLRVVHRGRQLQIHSAINVDQTRERIILLATEIKET
jgi:SPP1 family predicted phage head-tail adaptor